MNLGWHDIIKPGALHSLQLILEAQSLHPRPEGRNRQNQRK